MSEAADLRFHADALRLLAVVPRFDSDAADQIARAEAACGRPLPAAVREWYTLTGAEELLTLDNNACGVMPLAEFLRYFVQGRREVEFYGPRRANTGYQAFIRLDGADDPPIVVDGDPGPVPFAEYVRGVAEYKVSSGL
ncbi:MAG: hypothetical protein JWO38_1093 [Gemmataceae bacterium]|nr:hypothetical protein [Gemmataceae bacterium]